MRPLLKLIRRIHAKGPINVVVADSYLVAEVGVDWSTKLIRQAVEESLLVWNAENRLRLTTKSFTLILDGQSPTPTITPVDPTRGQQAVLKLLRRIWDEGPINLLAPHDLLAYESGMEDDWRPPSEWAQDQIIKWVNGLLRLHIQLTDLGRAAFKPNVDPTPGSLDVPVVPAEVAIPEITVDDATIEEASNEIDALEFFRRAVQSHMQETANRPDPWAPIGLSAAQRDAEAGRDRARQRERMRGAAALMAGLRPVFRAASPMGRMTCFMRNVARVLLQRFTDSTDHRPLELD